MNDKLIRKLMRRVYRAAEKSTDRVTRNGAMLVHIRNANRVDFHTHSEHVSIGFNHHVTGYGSMDEHHERPLKYSLTEHAERDTILEAARLGRATQGTTMVANWIACPDCARAIFLAGIKTVVCHKQCMDRTPPRWKEMVDLGLEILRRGGVELIQWDGNVGRVKNLNNGEIWWP